ncbi:Plasmodium exported protein, unknown function [Plasmodium relictum]|uniref:Fam-h protein n=1 Tax=Plasmodium relictum TaxID=85471 RepID=A0A1J1GKE6_PLARL|nr:Plasmodium exported protein, unknown function [Plasmodium relictum]CRG85192.1 Plasmodium exported protein, unknown function [Plasmodium relictum]
MFYRTQKINIFSFFKFFVFTFLIWILQCSINSNYSIFLNNKCNLERSQYLEVKRILSEHRKLFGENTNGSKVRLLDDTDDNRVNGLDGEENENENEKRNPLEKCVEKCEEFKIHIPEENNKKKKTDKSKLNLCSLSFCNTGTFSLAIYPLLFIILFVLQKSDVFTGVSHNDLISLQLLFISMMVVFLSLMISGVYDFISRRNNA